MAPIDHIQTVSGLRVASNKVRLRDRRWAGWDAEAARQQDGAGTRNTTVSLIITSQKLGYPALLRLAIQGLTIVREVHDVTGLAGGLSRVSASTPSDAAISTTAE